MAHRWPSVALFAVAWLLAGARSAPAHDRIAVVAGYEPSVLAAREATLGGYGWASVRWDREGLARGARLSLEWNTDTLRLGIDRVRFGRVELGALIAGELGQAGVLFSYVRDGHVDPGRSFYASYVTVLVGAKVDLAPHYLEVVVGGRRWFFGHKSDTDPRFTLPVDAWVGETRLRYTYWSIAPDPSLWEPQRSWWRVRGVAIGVEIGAEQRSDASPWGARDATFVPSDPRNAPLPTIVGAHQWLRAGVRVHDRVRLQLREEAHVLWGEDDLVRVRIGGMGPYSVPLAGSVWAGYLAGRLAAIEGSVHVRVAREHEIGVLVDGVVLDDARRVGDGRAAVLAGVGVFADCRWRGLQLDLRAGWSPTVQPGRAAGGFTVLAAIGWGWFR